MADRSLADIQAAFERVSHDAVSAEDWTSAQRAIQRCAKSPEGQQVDAANNREALMKMWLALKQTAPPDPQGKSSRLSSSQLSTTWQQLRVDVSVEKQVFALDYQESLCQQAC